jgi:hypothetical protein
MTALITQTVVAALSAGSYEQVSGVFGAIAIGLLAALLVLKELARTRPGRTNAGLAVFDVAALPLLFVFALVIGLRLLSLIQL